MCRYCPQPNLSWNYCLPWCWDGCLHIPMDNNILPIIHFLRQHYLLGVFPEMWFHHLLSKVDNRIPDYGNCCGEYILRFFYYPSRKHFGWLGSDGNRLFHILGFLYLSRIRCLSVHTIRHQVFHYRLHLWIRIQFPVRHFLPVFLFRFWNCSKHYLLLWSHILPLHSEWAVGILKQCSHRILLM